MTNKSSLDTTSPCMNTHKQTYTQTGARDGPLQYGPLNVDPNDLLINQLSDTTFSCLSLNISSLKKLFQTLQTEITDNFCPSIIGFCGTKIDSNIEQLYNLAGYNLITNNNQLYKGGLALYIKKQHSSNDKTRANIYSPWY